MKRKVILDVDTGTDDSIAIMLAVLSNQFDILGITVTWGNQSVDDCALNTIRVLDYLNSDIPVYKGCSEPMAINLNPKRVEKHKGNKIEYEDENGVIHHLHPKVLPFGEAKSKIQNKHACSFLVETLMNSKEKITLIPVGPCTNIGMAFRMEPRIKDHIEEIVFMGGSVNMGNVTPTAEANFFHDPEAVKIILNSGVKCKITALNATMSCPLSMEMANELEALNTKAGIMASKIMRIRMDVSKHLGWSDGLSDTIHDPLAVASLLDESVILEKKSHCVDIEVSDELTDGTLIIKDTNDPSEYNATIYYKADTEKYFKILKETFMRY